LGREEASGGSQGEPSGYVDPAGDERSEGNPFPRGNDGNPMVSAMRELTMRKLTEGTYCPPAVGYADRNSASDAAKHKLQMPAVTSPQMTLVEPPDGKASPIDDDSAVHEFKMAKASPSIDKRLKLRFNSPLCPSACNWASSSRVCRSTGFMMAYAGSYQIRAT